MIKSPKIKNAIKPTSADNLHQNTDFQHQTELLQSMQTVPWFDAIFQKYKELLPFAPAIAEFVQRHGWKFLKVFDSWDEWIIIQIGTEKESGWFFIKCPHGRWSIQQEIKNHKAFYQVFLEEKGKTDSRLENVEMPHIIDDLSDKFGILIMDKLPGKTVRRLLIEHFFSPVFQNKALAQEYDMENMSDREVIRLIEKIASTVEKDKLNPASYIYHEYIEELENEYNEYKEKDKNTYMDKNGFFMKSLRKDIRERDVMKESDLEGLALLLGDKWTNVLSGIKNFQSVFQEHGMSHNDLHSWNVMVIPQKDGSYNAWIIDFGQVTLPKKYSI